ncbi:MAG TPA: ribbon-helix-helix protein, CopG family [Gemmatimonadales bacterium]|nr:ribbon-helix-helix protein, CopG family [Gemmatimonadales bacterium]
MKTISLKVPSELEVLLDRMAEELLLSRSAVVREALVAYSATRGASVTSRADAVVSPVEGPSDLSTNPRYLDDFGK